MAAAVVTGETVRVVTGDAMLVRARRVVHLASLLLSSVAASAVAVVLLPRRKVHCSSSATTAM